MITLFINIRYYSNMERKYKAVGKISRRYTKEEDEIIINEVKNYPTNLLHAFTEAARKIEGRSVKTISQKWYVYLKKREDVSALTCGSNVECMSSWGLRGTNQSKYTELLARQNAENSTTAPITYTHC